MQHGIFSLESLPTKITTRSSHCHVREASILIILPLTKRQLWHI
jgi:hypothetical protein